MAAGTHLPAVLKALRFHGASTEALTKVPESVWPKLLDELDQSQLTLALAARAGDSLPVSVRARFHRNLADNAARHEQLLVAHREIGEVLASRHIDYVVMKGLSQWPYYTDDPRARPQYDIDLYFPGDSITAAADAMRDLGYDPAGVSDDPGADHLPVMIRKTGWTWQHDYYDPEMPPSLELHFRFWNAQRMGFDPGDLGQFWRRRVLRNICGLEFSTLDPVDGLTYSGLHLLRHLLGGDLRPRHVYELAHFLERSADDDDFWSRWSAASLRSCRVLEAIAFRLASDWFRCRLHPAAREAVELLPSGVRRWFALFGSTPVGTEQQSGKNELWLHFCLLESRKARLGIALRRLFPVRRSRVVRDAHVPSASMGLRLRLRRVSYEAAFLRTRLLHHLKAFAPTIRGACLWCAGRR